MASLRDVAKRAGTSVATASRVLNQPDKVRPETRELVEKAMRELLFITPKSGQSERIAALFIPNLHNPMFTKITEAIESAAKEVGWSILLCTTGDDAKAEQMHAQEFFTRQISSLIFVSSVAANTASYLPHYKALQKSGARLIFINGSPDKIKSTSISDDELTAGRLAAEYLIGLGHKKIGFITGTRTSSIRSSLRLSGIKQVAETGDDIKIKTMYGDWGVEGGYQSITQLKKIHPDITGIICASDLQAIGVINYFHQIGVRIPEDISIVGSDGIDQGIWVTPTLTTIKLPVDSMANAVGNWLTLDGSETSNFAGNSEILFKPELVVRNSTSVLK
jgi:DNA-binding LacI/PurR family transcriptional regulator